MGRNSNRAKWVSVRCWSCSGYGVYSSYGSDGDWSPEECGPCWGSGRIWLSHNDRYALYPGGPLRGTDPGAYARAIDGEHQRIARIAAGDLS